MSGRVAGTLYIKVDGIQFEINGDVQYTVSQVMRETIMSLTGPAGFKETAQRPYLKFKAIFTSDLPINLLTSLTNATLVAEMPNHGAFTLVNSYLSGEIIASGDEGTIDLEFSGDKGIFVGA